MHRFLPILLLLAATELAAATPDELLVEVERQQLQEDPHWLRLGHYQPTLFGDWESEIDGEDFFLAENGKDDPGAELEATIRAWFGDERDDLSDQPVRCRFQARFAWLDEKLDLYSYRKPPECEGFRDWFEAINPGSLTLVFPSSYLNNPASMYGHTLLRIDPPQEMSELTSYAINFAARTEERNGFVFAAKGLTGLYDGYFAVLPYYRKVNEYNDIENRDIWEYPLDFTTAEINRMLMHLWEVGPASLEYYFFDENCSYQLLTLLEVARPGLRLSDAYTYQVIPADTVRQVLAASGDKEDVRFRAALATRLASQAEQMSDRQLALAEDIVAGHVALEEAPLKDLGDREQAQLLDMAYLMIQFRHFSEGGQQEDSSRLALPLLRARAQLDVKEPFVPVTAPDSAPHRGHGTMRLSLGGGESADVRYRSIGLRAAYHDLLDPWPGFLEGASITMFGAEGRYYEDGTTRLQSLDLVEVESLAPRGRLFEPLSWRVAAGWNRNEPVTVAGDVAAPLAFTLSGGPGLSWSAPAGIVSAQFAGDFRYHDSLPGNQSWAFGPRFVYSASPIAGWTLLAEAEWQEYTSGIEGDRASLRLGQQWMLGNDIGLRLTLARERQADEYSSQAELRLMLYY
ncbi:MAG: DUF4105 domain-containing protein [Gammaproteobacteria bacterium]|nr:DUF4105 domain-containing protein [Gammaproteobacteria bacterium]